MNQTESFLSPEKTGEPVGHIIAAVPALNVLAEHSAKQENVYYQYIRHKKDKNEHGCEKEEGVAPALLLTDFQNRKKGKE